MDVCGDGEQDLGEDCDDGNNVGGDGCAPDCLSTEECGNGIVDAAAGEECDDGNLIGGDLCDGDCQVIVSSVCGNEVIDLGDDDQFCSTEYCTFVADPLGTCVYETLVCDDGKDCTGAGDGCNPSSGCQYEPQDCLDTPCTSPEGEPDPICMDDDLCTTDACATETGTCQLYYTECSDGDDCTRDWCNPHTGSCNYEDVGGDCISDCGLLGGDLYCDDDDSCTVDLCNEDDGTCIYFRIYCNDHDICTDDYCDPDEGCKFDFIDDCEGCETAADCDDTNVCTMDQCVDALPISLADDVYKGDSFPHPLKYCTYRSICTECATDAECEDAMAENLCIIAGTCNQGTGYCDFDTLDCNDDDPCTTDECNLFSGECINTDVYNCCESVDDCVDTNKCTGKYCFVEEMECAFPDYHCDDYDPCTADSCHVLTGDCEHEPIADCHNECEKDSDCHGFGTPLNYCVIPVCAVDPNDGLKKCDLDDAVVLDCIDSHACTDETCETIFGCQFIPTAPCDAVCETAADCFDDNLCTLDICNPATGQCDNQAKDCVDDFECTKDICNPLTGECENELACETCVEGDPDTACPGCNVAGEDADPICDDSNICTRDFCEMDENDPHVPGRCAYLHRTCNDGNPCTIDTCDPVAGCIFTPVDKCIGCMTDEDCFDKNDCTVDKCGSDHYCTHQYVCG